MTEIRWEQYPLVAQHELAHNWLQRQAHLQLAPNTVDAYGRCLNDYLNFCAKHNTQPEAVTRDLVVQYVQDLVSRPNLKGSNILSIKSGRGLSNSTMQQRITVLRLFCDALIEQQLRQDNPVGQGHYVPGKAFGGIRDRGLLPLSSLDMSYCPKSHKVVPVMTYRDATDFIRVRSIFLTGYTTSMSKRETPSKKTEQQGQQVECDSSPNTEWQLKHQLPKNPTLDQSVTWHMEHARRCPCPSQDQDILEELKKRYLGKHQDFWIFYTRNDHRALGLWAAHCAEHLLPYFEEKYPEDTRPKDATRTLRAWVQTGEFRMAVIRGASLGAHAAAKAVKKEDTVANFAAHAAGQAVGTAHVPTHALGPVLYSMKLVAALHPSDIKAAVAQERAWETQRLPEQLRPWVDAWFEKTYPLLPKQLRMQ